MKSRIVGAVIAVLLAVVGTVILVSYVNAADERAMAGTETVNVLVVSNAIAAGTPAAQLTESISEQAVPARIVPTDAVTNLSELDGLVSTVDLVPGEQLLSSRFADPDALADSDSIPVPEGMQEFTILLEPQRVVGGQLAAGDTVGVFVSLDVGPDEAEPVTKLIMHKVLITAIQGLGTAVPDETTEETGTAPIPPGSVLVTLARTAPDAEKLVFAQEFGRIWLSKEPATASEDGTRQLTIDGLFE